MFIILIGILNLRGSDINYNPVFFSYLFLDLNDDLGKGYLFID
jgi:hypothetical protein